MMVLPSREVVESFTRPLQRMNTPRGCCPSMNNMAPFGYTAVDFISLSRWQGCAERLQNRCSLRTGQVTQLSRMFRPYGARIQPPSAASLYDIGIQGLCLTLEAWHAASQSQNGSCGSPRTMLYARK